MIVKAISEIERYAIKDALGRTFKTLRISLTNNCNLACNYCVPEKHKNSIPVFQKLSCDDYLKAVKSIHTLTGIHTVRLTGGEPLLYNDIIPLIKGIKKIGIKNVKMTTNGLLLRDLAEDLMLAGLDSVNVSLDALDEETFFKVSRRRNVSRIIKGINKTLEQGVKVKLNCVVMKGINDDQILPLLDFASARAITIRYLELMNMGHMQSEHSQYFFSEEEILKTISKKYNCYEIKREESSTANYWITNTLKRFGIISNISHPFCSDCNRLRLDSYGKIFGCLSSNKAISIMDCLDDPEVLAIRLQTALLQKQTSFTGSSTSMKSIGG